MLMSMKTQKFGLLTGSVFTKAQRMKQRLSIEISLISEGKKQRL